MTKFIAVISGKGGVGKTTVAINLALALLSVGRRTVLLDADLHTPNVGLHLGAHFSPKNSYDVIEDGESILDVSYRHISGLQMIPAKLHADISITHFNKLAGKLRELDDSAEIVLVDMPSGLNSDLKVMLEKCDHSIVVATPDFPSVTSALKAIRLSHDLGKQVLGAVVNMESRDDFEMGKEEIEAMLGTRVLVSIPDESSIRESISLRKPVMYSHPQSVSAEMFRKLAISLLA
ncbi:P-loop NTPase [Thermoproteota archaeon]